MMTMMISAVIDFTHKVKDWVDTERSRVEKRVQDFLVRLSCTPRPFWLMVLAQSFTIRLSPLCTG
jgi:hypothetical protein